MPAAATMTAPSEEGASVSAAAAVASAAGPDAGPDGGGGPLTVVRAVTSPLYPTVGQTGHLNRLLGAMCDVYNAALESRRGRWAWNRESVTRFDQFKDLTGPESREVIPGLAEFGIGPFRGALTRLDRAFAAFFRRVKEGQTPGFPRFKAKARFDSFDHPTYGDGWKITTTGKGTYGRLYVRGVGHVKIRLHRHAEMLARGGTPAKLTVRRRGHGPRARWEATVFYTGIAPNRLAPTGVSAGADVGVTVAVAVADTAGGTDLIDNPDWASVTGPRIAALQAKAARQKKGSNRRRRTLDEIARLKAKDRRRRNNWAHQTSRRLVDCYDELAVEKLNVAGMTRAPKPKPNPDPAGGEDSPGTGPEFLPNGAAAKAGLNRKILDVGWSQLAAMIAYKAEEAGRRHTTVKPPYTSQTCHTCGHISPGNRDGTVFACEAPDCGNEDHADLNAARNIAALAGIDVPTVNRPGSDQHRHPRCA